MSNRMTYKDFLNILQKTCQTDKADVTAKLSQYVKGIADRVVRGEEFLMSGLGIIEGHKHGQYESVDEATGSLTLYPPRISVAMRSLKDYDADSTDVTDSSASDASEDVIVEVIKRGLDESNEVQIQGFGTFRRQTTVIGTRIVFLPEEKFREMCNAPFSCFSPIEIN